ncbi:hypothetical protein EJB05_14092, partial [Eragrostis curvula]
MANLIYICVARFNYMAISDDIQRYMPSAVDRESPRGVPLAYKEAVLLVDPVEPQFKGEVDDKYQYSMDNKDNMVHGWIGNSNNNSDLMGFWVITPSNEFKNGGPLKRELTSHTGPTSLSVFLGSHYVGRNWKKVLGPVFIYLNSKQGPDNKTALWEDAKAQAQAEVNKWPYDFPRSPDFAKARERGSVEGTLWVRDRVISIGDLLFEPPRSGPTLWEIGVPDRTVAEFYIPDPDPKYLSKLFVTKDRVCDRTCKYRQYGLWERYVSLYPENDLVYTVGKSNYSTDWFFAHIVRKVGDKSIVPSTWQIRFHLDRVIEGGNYMLRIALAASHMSSLKVQVNERAGEAGVFTWPELLGDNNAIARHGIHGTQWNMDMVIQGGLLNKSNNTIYVTQMGALRIFVGVMYDYIRLEEPSS